MNTDLMFSSKTGEWDTPQPLIDDLKTVFDFDLDACASRPNVCENYYNEQQNGLLNDWGGTVWCNPPYGRGIGEWLEFGNLSVGSFGLAKCVVFLVPVRTDTRWWQNNVPHASHVVFIKGRLKFGKAKSSAPFPSAFVVFGEIGEAQKEKLFSYGWGVSS